jgi:hypothetical protein
MNALHWRGKPGGGLRAGHRGQPLFSAAGLWRVAMKQLLLPVTAAILAAAVPALASQPSAANAPAAKAPAPEEVRIPFASFGQIRNFRDDGDRAVYFEGTRRQWYRATLYGPCLNLPSAIRIGFENRFSDTLDNTSTLLVDGERCRIASLVRSDPPPSRRRARR